MESGGFLSAAVDVTSVQPKAMSRGRAVGLVFIGTLLSAAGQVLIKHGANSLTRSSPLAMLTNLPLLAGYVLYGLMTVLFIFALRDEELSIVFPIISLTYVWVTGLSMYFFHEHLNPAKALGVLVIVAGVAVLGRDGRK